MVKLMCMLINCSCIVLGTVVDYTCYSCSYSIVCVNTYYYFKEEEEEEESNDRFVVDIIS